MTLLMVVTLIVAGGSYLGNVFQRRSGAAEVAETARRSCLALKGVLTTFRKQEEGDGANARRLQTYDRALLLVKDC